MNDCLKIAHNPGFLDELIDVKLTRFELNKIRDWNLKRMDAAAVALENPIMKPAKRSRWQVEYDFHAQLCDHLHGIDPDCKDKIREHNARIESQLEIMESALAEMRARYDETKKQLVATS
ncbi:MAG: hypothetical protein K2M87_05090 [Muribaculaceae bacterium]|nr:hypothetical protein [Muribaculaceae bacterium]